MRNFCIIAFAAFWAGLLSYFADSHIWSSIVFIVLCAIGVWTCYELNNPAEASPINVNDN